MGFFDWLTGKSRKVEIAKYRIWLTRQAKSDGIRKEVAQAVADPAGPSAVIAVAHFSDCLEQLQTALADLDQDRLLLTRADLLAGRTPTELTTDQSTGVLVIVGERHPLPSRDEAVLDFARSLPCRCRLVYHVSLEDAVFKRVSGGWVENVLRRMGMKEDEAIESRMVIRRLQDALKKIERTATGSAPANSAEEWFERNCL
jgi:hypothetical protein